MTDDDSDDVTEILRALPSDDALRGWADGRDTYRRTSLLEWAVLAVVFPGLVAVAFVVLAF